MANILITKFINGEEVLGDVIDVDAEFFEIDNPVGFFQQPSAHGSDSATIALVPFANLSKHKKIKFKKTSIVCQYEPILEMENNYRKLFGSGIILPKTIA